MNDLIPSPTIQKCPEGQPNHQQHSLYHRCRCDAHRHTFSSRTSVEEMAWGVYGPPLLKLPGGNDHIH